MGWIASLTMFARNDEGFRKYMSNLGTVIFAIVAFIIARFMLPKARTEKMGLSEATGQTFVIITMGFFSALLMCAFSFGILLILDVVIHAIIPTVSIDKLMPNSWVSFLAVYVAVYLVIVLNALREIGKS